MGDLYDNAPKERIHEAFRLLREKLEPVARIGKRG
jgi:hypothetical protein